MIKIKPLLPILLLLIFHQSFAYEKRNLLQKEISKEKLRMLLSTDREWVPYPDYLDRQGWDKLTSAFKEELVRKGEAFLDYDWKVVKATDYLAYERNGSRDIMQNPFGENGKAISDLVLAELAEGEGRFMDQIINGVFYHCEMTSWVLSAHLPAFQSTGRSLPDYKEHVIDLTAGDMGSLMSWIYYFFREEFDQVDPVISERLKTAIRVRILEPYMQRDDFWWQAMGNYKPGDMVNNWNPWCNFNVLSAFLLMEDDLDKLVDGVYKTMVSTDEFINYNHEDGACEEGPSYWGHAAGKLYDYLKILSDATGGEVSVFDQPIIKNMGEYIARSYVGDGWVVNFADASAKGGGNAPLIYRYGQAVQSDMMMQYAGYLNQGKHGAQISAGRDMFRSLESILYYEGFSQAEPRLPHAKYSWYPQTQFCYMRTESGFFLATKGGYNSESHNHNDVGTFSLYYNNLPFFIDAGVGTYTKDTFSKNRYQIWTMQSDYHNLPKINGVSQVFGKQYKAQNMTFSPRQSKVSLDIAKAYPKDAQVEKWLRHYELKEKGGLMIEDEFTLSAVESPNILNYLVWSEPVIKTAGKVVLTVEDEQLIFEFDPKQFDVRVEAIPQDDPRLANVWGDAVYRLSLIAKEKSKKGKYKFYISPLTKGS